VTQVSQETEAEGDIEMSQFWRADGWRPQLRNDNAEDISIVINRIEALIICAIEQRDGIGGISREPAGGIRPKWKVLIPVELSQLGELAKDADRRITTFEQTPDAGRHPGDVGTILSPGHERLAGVLATVTPR
jgi:hypothetical protein